MLMISGQPNPRQFSGGGGNTVPSVVVIPPVILGTPRPMLVLHSRPLPSIHWDTHPRQSSGYHRGTLPPLGVLPPGCPMGPGKKEGIRP